MVLGFALSGEWRDHGRPGVVGVVIVAVLQKQFAVHQGCSEAPCFIFIDTILMRLGAVVKPSEFDVVDARL